jgi:hypothetical protein
MPERFTNTNLLQMMPHQSQGACMAIEDAAALGIIFNLNYFQGDIAEALAIYEEVRLPRATRVQAAAAKAAYNINERIGTFSPPAKCKDIHFILTEVQASQAIRTLPPIRLRMKIPSSQLRK